MTTRPTVDWCVSTLEYLIGMSTLVDEAGLAGLPEQRLVMCFKQSEFEVVDVIIFIWVVDSQVFVKGIVFSSVLYCVSVLQSATVARIPQTRPNTLPPCCHPPSVDKICTRPNTLLHLYDDPAPLCLLQSCRRGNCLEGKVFQRPGLRL